MPYEILNCTNVCPATISSTKEMATISVVKSNVVDVDVSVVEDTVVEVSVPVEVLTVDVVDLQNLG